MPTETKYSAKEFEIMRQALPVVEAVPMSQNECWPGDGPGHDDECGRKDHSASAAAVKATEGLSWDFSTWKSTARWLREALQNSEADDNPTATLIETIKATVAEILKTGNSAPKLYLRVRPDGSVDVNEETSWCCSPDEYYKNVPHTLSLEVLKSTRDYSDLSEAEIEECADGAEEAAERIVAGWKPYLDEWIAAGNLEDVDAAENADVPFHER